MAEDARIRKTKEKLSQALVELLKTNNFSDISPAQICEKAGINRSTFYRNYRNTTQLKNEIEQKFLDSVEWSDRGQDLVYSRNAIMKQLQFLKENQSTFFALSQDSFKETVFEKVSQKLIDSAITKYPKYAERVTLREYTRNCVFLINGMVAIFREWFETDMQDDTEEVTEFILKKLKEGHQAYL